ncbi:30S ribosomal protein S8 [bacterium]|nr:30S ribosomal protein S8 [bacterium]
MTMTDPIADLLTRIRNASSALHKNVEIPASKIKNEIVRVLKEEGYIENSEIIKAEPQDVLKVYLKYTPENKPVIINLSRISKPGLRKYSSSKSVPQVMGGLGIAILSTPKGILTDRQAKRENIGGEVLCYVW